MDGGGDSTATAPPVSPGVPAFGNAGNDYSFRPLTPPRCVIGIRPGQTSAACPFFLADLIYVHTLMAVGLGEGTPLAFAVGDLHWNSISFPHDPRSKGEIMGTPPDEKKCSNCNGTGRCQNCRGTGKSGYFGGSVDPKASPCLRCSGSGVCQWCRGTGKG